jgi:F420-non-reducing hydrogenase iron-sulfur subunit
VKNNFEPNIVTFLCNWCSYECADSVGKSQKEYPPNLRIVRVMCSGRVDPQFVLEAFKEGAEGVLILGCKLGECHYKEGNFNVMKRFFLLRKVLQQFGIEQDRVKLDWVSASEEDKFVKVVSEMVEGVRKLGPIILPHPPLSKEGSEDFIYSGKRNGKA